MMGQNKKSGEHFVVFYLLSLFWLSFIATFVALIFNFIFFSGVFLLVSLVSLLLFFYFAPFHPLKKLKQIFFRRHWYSWQNAFLLKLWIGAFLVYALFLFKVLDFSWDFSKEGIFSLDDASKQVVRSIKQPIEVLYFSLPTSEEYQEVQRVLKNFAKENKNIRIRFVNLAKGEELANRFKVSSRGEVVFLVDGNAVERVVPADLLPQRISAWGSIENIFNYEQSFRQTFAAINQKYFLKEKPYLVTFVAGQFPTAINKAENSIKNGLNDWMSDWSSFAELLSRSGFDVKFLNLPYGAAPSFFDSDVVIFDGGSFFSENLKGTLSEYLQNGGNALLLLNPSSTQGGRSSGNTRNTRDNLFFLDIFNLSSSGGLIVDRENISPYLAFLTEQSPPPVLPGYPHLFYGEHPITASLKKNSLPPFFGGATGFFLREGRPRNLTLFNPKTVDPLIFPSATAWSEKNYKSEMEEGGTVVFNPGLDSSSEKWMGAAIDFGLDYNSARAVVVGDTEFLKNGLIDLAGNRMLAFNMVKWLVKKDDELAIAFKKRYWQPVSYSSVQKTFFLIFCIAILPLLIFFFAIFTVLKRRLALNAFARK